MSMTSSQPIGKAKALRRYPVKSMTGENLAEAVVIDGGFVGDRAYAVVDLETGNIASAKLPRKWGRLAAFDASFVHPPAAEGPPPPVRVTCPDGTEVIGDPSDPGLDTTLSQILGRKVRLTAVRPETISVERLDPLASEETIVDIGAMMMAGRFADYAAIHLLSTATLMKLSEIAPDTVFDSRRFRPNILVESPAEQSGFVENAWVGHVIAIGDEVRLRVTDPSPRCAVPTLAREDLPGDPGIVRTIAAHNSVAVPALDGAELPCAGVYAFVEQGGTIRTGDAMRIMATD